MSPATQDWPRSGGGGSVAPAGHFDPFDVDDTNDLLLWLRADAIQGLADAAAISTWPDLSGNARSPTQGTSASRPSFRTNVLNGYPVVRFDGGDFMRATAFAHPTQWTVISVGKSSSGALPQGICGADGAAPRIWQHRLNTASFESLVFNTTPAAFTDGQTDTPTSFAVRTSKRETAQVTSYVNGIAAAATATTGTPASGSHTFEVGQTDDSGGGKLTGDIAEIIYFSGALSDSDRAAIEDYLATKYAL